jgi:glycosyltransferase involved in cell wall biosynthesis
MKTIVMVGNTSWGMLKFRGDLMKELISSGNRVIVLAPADNYSQSIKDLGAGFFSLELDRKGTNPFADFLYFLRLLKHLLKLRPDVVLTYTIKPVLYGVLAARVAGVPLRIAVTTGLGYIFSKDNFVSRLTKVFYKLSLLFASQVWFLNSEDQSAFTTGNLVADHKTFVLPGEGVDVEFFRPEVNESAEITFTLVSRLLWDKGVGLFAKSAEEIKKRYPHVQFQILGLLDEGNPEGIPASQVQEWNEKGFVRYLGSLDDIRPVLKKTACLVHPTYYKEGIPRILMEASAMGIPCITTNIAGCRDVIVHGNSGFLVEPKNEKALTDAIIQFLETDRSHSRKMGEQGRERIVKMYSSERINSIYKERLAL